ncbi:MAG TPA: glycosyl hydrolase 108 family protein [Acidobacteriaceae bacterium]|nr:glycosyl hydrolase 108 family protein [Acidobacteriaceae bacterium]
MASFDPAIAFVLANEGATGRRDTQTGEYSRYGITRAIAIMLQLCPPAEAKSLIDGLTEDRVKDFYLDRFWRPLQLDKFPQPIATKVLDMAVMMGQLQAVKILQRACRALGATIAIDGVLGIRTVQAIHILWPYVLLLELRAECLQFYSNLVMRDPAKYAKYWDGWKARAEK